LASTHLAETVELGVHQRTTEGAMLAIKLAARGQSLEIGGAYFAEGTYQPTAGRRALALEGLQLGEKLPPLGGIVMPLANPGQRGQGGHGGQQSSGQLRWRNTCRDLVHANEFNQIHWRWRWRW